VLCHAVQATRRRSELLEYIQQASGVATLLDVRRTEAYDAAKAVDTLLDSAAVRAWMGASNQVRAANPKPSTPKSKPATAAAAVQNAASCQAKPGYNHVGVLSAHTSTPGTSVMRLSSGQAPAMNMYMGRAGPGMDMYMPPNSYLHGVQQHGLAFPTSQLVIFSNASAESSLLRASWKRVGCITVMQHKQTVCGAAMAGLPGSLCVEHALLPPCCVLQVGRYSSCSSAVEAAMSADVMRSVLVLVEDLLDALPVLLYQVRPGL
jgi:hypothetical protein